MGNVVSSNSAVVRVSERVTSESETMNASGSLDVEDSECGEEYHDTVDEDTERTKAKENEMEEFKKQLEVKREQRREILIRHRTEKDELEKSLEKERKAKLEAYEANTTLRELLLKNNIEIPENVQSSKESSDISRTIIEMREEFEKLKLANNKLRRELADTNSTLQQAYSDIADLNGKNRESMKQISALKEVVTVSKTMINLREEQLEKLKNKLNEIERTMADRETATLSADLRREYVRQLQNIRTLRNLYEERARLAEVTRQGLIREAEEHKRLKQVEVDKCKELSEKMDQLETQVEDLQETIETKSNQISCLQDETRGLQAEMSAVNKLFSQVLLGYKTKQDLDKLVHRLEENHGLLTHMAEKENGSEASSALPKLLLELVTQVDEVNETKEIDNDGHAKEIFSEDTTDVAEHKNPAISAEEIVQHLPKVWRVLIELLSHQNIPEENPAEKVTTCFKSVETKNGPVLVPSVSQTYIRLKDLIIEKLSLIKEVNRMKQLNVHLESRLGEQEKKLSLVTTELSKTWHVVGRLRRQHHQLHTHEKILKYELQQKRKLLNELKEELEYCREKWEQAREKNSQSERDFRKLRNEFSARKAKTTSTSFNNSAESGYSDERPSDESSESNDESEYITGSLKRSKKKNKKSFETVVDSSTDFNLAAEREDPASDMIDVAELPLDTHEGDENHESCVSDSYNSENMLKSEKLCEETEDEALDIDSCTEEKDIPDKSPEQTVDNANDFQEDVTHKMDQPSTSTISDASLNSNMTTKDQLSENTENMSSATSLQEFSNESSTEENNDKISQNINSALECNLTSDSSMANKKIDDCESRSSDKDDKSIFQPSVAKENINSDKVNDIEISAESNTNDVTEETTIDFKAILENVKRQNERLAEKDERLQNLEEGCAAVVNHITNTLASGNDIMEKLNELHDKHDENLSCIDDSVSTKEDTESLNDDDAQPSTSADVDHEARFAARDLRLKRLEEQTKSLVNKVNKTTSKGMKINYKLEELHNIYGSESSRAGTPSDNDDSKSNEPNNESNSE